MRTNSPSARDIRAIAVIGAILALGTYRASLAHTYGRLYHGLGLTTAQIAEFENLLTAGQRTQRHHRHRALRDLRRPVKARIKVDCLRFHAPPLNRGTTRGMPTASLRAGGIPLV